VTVVPVLITDTLNLSRNSLRYLDPDVFSFNLNLQEYTRPSAQLIEKKLENYSTPNLK
jgi:hypothetical protein